MTVSRTALSLLFCLLLSTLSTGRLDALVMEDVLFYQSFNDNLIASIARGAAAPISSNADIRLTDGYRGQGALFGHKGSDTAYSTKGNISADAGTISMWLKPVDWGGNEDSYNRYFFRISEAAIPGASSGNNFLWLYKYFQNPVYWLAQRDAPERKTYVVYASGGDIAGLVPYTWEKGRWVNFTACWSANQMLLYIDGQYAGSTYTAGKRVLEEFVGQFTLGGENGRNGGTPDTVMDEVIILRKPLAPNEAKAIYQSGIDAAKSGVIAQPVLNIAAGYNSARGSAYLTTEVVGLQAKELKSYSVNYRITDGSKKIALDGKLPLSQLRESRHVDCSNLRTGEYSIAAELVKGGVVVSRIASTFRRQQKPVWVGNRIGISSRVLSAWTPISVKDNTLSCWGRTYTWRNGSLLPTQITTQKQELLQNPIRLSATVDGKDCVLKNAGFQWTIVKPNYAEYAAKGNFGTVSVRVFGRVEYDGFIWNTIKLDKGDTNAKTSISSLQLSIPMLREVATLMYGEHPVPASGHIRSFRGEFTGEPVVWLGNETGGLQWSTSQFKDWHLRDRGATVVLDVGNSGVDLRLNLIDNPTELTKPLSFTFGLQATPVKPMRADFREWEMRLNNINCSKENSRKAWAFYRTDWNRLGKQIDGPYSYLYPSQNTYKLVDDLEAQNMVPFIYWNLHYIWAGDPVLTHFPEWGEFLSGGESVHPYSGIRPDHNNADQSNYSLWMNANLLKDKRVSSGFRGYYLDTSEAGWDNGVFTVIGTRNLQKRFYTMIKETLPNWLVMNHQSASMHMYQLSFADGLVTGENFAMNPNLMRDFGYYNVLTLDGMRAEYCGRNVGVPVIFLPNLLRSYGGDQAARNKILSSEGIPASEHLAGMLWIHDIVPWISDINPVPLRQAARAKDAFGWDEGTEFIGYWQNQGYIAVNADKAPVVVSIFRRQGRALFVVMNNSDEDAVVDIAPDWNKLGVGSPLKLVDVYLEQSDNASAQGAGLYIPLSDGKARFTVKARSFRALAAR